MCCLLLSSRLFRGGEREVDVLKHLQCVWAQLLNVTCFRLVVGMFTHRTNGCPLSCLYTSLPLVILFIFQRKWSFGGCLLRAVQMSWLDHIWINGLPHFPLHGQSGINQPSFNHFVVCSDNGHALDRFPPIRRLKRIQTTEVSDRDCT